MYPTRSDSLLLQLISIDPDVRQTDAGVEAEEDDEREGDV